MATNGMTKHNKWKVLKVWGHIKSAMTSSSQSCVCAKQEKLITLMSKVSLFIIMYIIYILFFPPGLKLKYITVFFIMW